MLVYGHRKTKERQGLKVGEVFIQPSEPLYSTSRLLTLVCFCLVLTRRAAAGESVWALLPVVRFRLSWHTGYTALIPKGRRVWRYGIGPILACGMFIKCIGWAISLVCSF